MGKKKQSDEFDFEKMAKKTGGDVLDDIDSVKYFVDTGSLALNYICSGRFIDGGIPGDKITEIFGPSSSSKSLLGTNILFGCQKLGGVAVLLDCENTANKEFIKTASHCNLKKILRYTPMSLEQVFAKIYEIVPEIRDEAGPDRPIVIVYDSIGVSASERELRECNLPPNYTQADFKRIVGGKEQPGERAKVCSKELRKLNAKMADLGVTVVILNQTRSKVGIMFGSPETTAGGGNSLVFYASCRIRPQTQKKIEQKLTAKKKKILGINVAMKNVKNKTSKPFVSSDSIQLLFNKGINPLSGLLTCLLEDGRISGKSGTFVVNEPWAGGREIKFKANVERNDIPMSLLLDCPALIGAEDSQQVQEYLEPYLPAINFQAGVDVEETQVSDDGDDDEMIDEILGNNLDPEEEE